MNKDRGYSATLRGLKQTTSLEEHGTTSGRRQNLVVRNTGMVWIAKPVLEERQLGRRRQEDEFVRYLSPSL